MSMPGTAWAGAGAGAGAGWAAADVLRATAADTAPAAALIVVANSFWVRCMKVSSSSWHVRDACTDASLLLELLK